jgi:mRNA-degrading endonuclease RelE of RelBE toxin-antitoxin system
MSNQQFIKKVVESGNFLKDLKKLSKRYNFISEDLKLLTTRLENGEIPGDRISDNKYPVYKVRIKNSDVKRGKSGGYRVIYYTVTSNAILLITIYSKSDRANISNQEIESIINTSALLIDRLELDSEEVEPIDLKGKTAKFTAKGQVDDILKLEYEKQVQIEAIEYKSAVIEYLENPKTIFDEEKLALIEELTRHSMAERGYIDPAQKGELSEYDRAFNQRLFKRVEENIQMFNTEDSLLFIKQIIAREMKAEGFINSPDFYRDTPDIIEEENNFSQQNLNPDLELVEPPLDEQAILIAIETLKQEVREVCKLPVIDFNEDNLSYMRDFVVYRSTKDSNYIQALGYEDELNRRLFETVENDISIFAKEHILNIKDLIDGEMSSEGLINPKLLDDRGDEELPNSLDMYQSNPIINIKNSNSPGRDSSVDLGESE